MTNSYERRMLEQLAEIRKRFEERTKPVEKEVKKEEPKKCE